MTLLQATNQEGWNDDKFIVEAKQRWEPVVDLRYPEMKEVHMLTYDNEQETAKLFEAKQLNDEFEDDSYITAATTEVGLMDICQGITGNEKSLTDNDHTNHQKEGTSRAQITETSPVQLKTHIQIPLLISPATPAQGRKRRCYACTGKKTPRGRAGS